VNGAAARITRVTLVVTNWIGLLLSTALGVLVGIKLRDHLQATEGIDADHGHAGVLTDALAYVSGVLGIMLGLMLFFSVQVYEEARQSAREEAVAMAEVFENAAFFPDPNASALRRDTICLMRSVVSDSWTAVEQGDVTGNRNTAAWVARVRDQVQALPTATEAQQAAQAMTLQTFQDSQGNRQHRLLSSTFGLPLIIWLVIDLGVFVFAALMIVSLPHLRRTAAVLIAACLLFTMGVIAALSMFATPFTHIGVSVRPVDVNAALSRLQDIYPDADWQPCPRLVSADEG
jgi:Protein of unknown function (DUF4239)